MPNKFLRGMTKMKLVTIAAATFVSLFVLSSAIPVYGAGSTSLVPPVLTPSIVPPVNTGILRDPSGTYVFTYLGNGEYSTNLTTYEKLLHDPYSGTSATNIQIIGNSVIMTTPQNNVTSLPMS